MITAIDTNILIDVVRPNPQFLPATMECLYRAANEGIFLISDIVYAEICGHFPSQQSCDDFLARLEIGVESTSRHALFAASRAWRVYRNRGGTRERILPDFLIGAHAELQANRLLTRDRGFYRDYFPALKILDPLAAPP